jgi:hypothetical protein
MVSCAPLETERPLSKTFVHLLLNKRVISNEKDEWDALYMCNLLLRACHVRDYYLSAVCF